MPGNKRSQYKKSMKKTYKKYGNYKKYNSTSRTLQTLARRAVSKYINKHAETKVSNQSPTDGQEIFHNNFITLSSTLLATSQGVEDPVIGTSNNRIGDEITLRGLSIRTMLEINERYSDVTFRIFVVKSAKGDTPTRATLFNGLSGNKMLDTINKERYTILASKIIKLKQAPQTVTSTTGTTSEVSLLGNNAGIEYPANADWRATLSRATKIVKMWIPGYKLANSKNSIMRYEHQSTQPKFYDYHLLCYAYSNYTTAQDVWYVARMNDTVIQLYFKDL